MTAFGFSEYEVWVKYWFESMDQICREIYSYLNASSQCGLEILEESVGVMLRRLWR